MLNSEQFRELRRGIKYWIDLAASNGSRVEKLYLKCSRTLDLINETMQNLVILVFGFFDVFTMDTEVYRQLEESFS